MQSTFLSLVSLAAVGLAAPTQPFAPSPTGAQQAQQFTLVAKVQNGNSSLGLDINNWVVTGIHDGAGSNAVTLNDSGPLDQYATRLYQNGTTKDTSCEVGSNNVLAAGSPPNVPYGFDTVPYVSSTDNPICEIRSGPGQSGTGVVKDAQGVPHFVGNGQLDGQFYVCNGLLFGPDPVQFVHWRNASSGTPSGCADIKLVAQCAGDLDNSTSFTQDLVLTPCLADAVGFDASPVVGSPNGDGQLEVPMMISS